MSTESDDPSCPAAPAPESKTYSKKTVMTLTSPLTAVKSLMYAFGDDHNPTPESVAVLEDILIEYITDMVPPDTSMNDY